MDALWSNEVWHVSILAFLVGLAAGAMVVYATFRPGHARRRQLQAGVERLEEELKAYRQEVNQYFQRTSELFETLTSSYRAFYDHLATGARRLCREERLGPALDIPRAQLLARPDEGQGSPPDPGLGERETEAGARGGARPATGGEPKNQASPEARERRDDGGQKLAEGESSVTGEQPA
jgi:hypothetical protein